MKQLIPLPAKNERQINALSFNDVDSSSLVSLLVDIELEIPVPDGAIWARIVVPSGGLIWISDTAGIVLPAGGTITQGNAEINPLIRRLDESQINRKLYALSSVALTFGVYFYND